MSEAPLVQQSVHDRSYFAEVRLEGIRAFGPVAKLSMRNSHGETDRWTVIVGENATGKSTLLETVYCLRPVQDDWGGDDNEGYSPALFVLGFTRDHPFVGSQVVDIGATVETTTAQGPHAQSFSTTVSDDGGQTDGIDIPFSVFAYTASRRIIGARLSSAENEAQISFLRVDPQDVPSPVEGLLKADYSARLGGTGKLSFGKLSRVVCDLLPEIDSVEAGVSAEDNNPTILFKRGEMKTLADQSGYGYLSTLAWVLDFAFKLADAFPHLEDPLQAPAICLVDEIDLHLHPQWQRTIVKTLLDTFPNVQFIVTAHSPIMVQASAGHNIVLLRRNKETGFVDIVNDVDEIANWRLDQILTSELFGFDSARPAEQTKLMQERIGILSEAEPSEEQRRRLGEIEAELENLPRGSTAEKVEMNRILDAALDRLKNPANWL